MTPFDQALQAAAGLPAEDRLLLLREVLGGLPLEDWPHVFAGRSCGEVAGVAMAIFLSLPEEAMPMLLVQIFEMLSPTSREEVVQRLYARGRQVRQGGG